jgi:uncharacterized protein (TIGR03435 family)
MISTLEYTTELPNANADLSPDPPAAPDLFAALEKQLGRQLLRKKLAFDVLLIDAFDRLPTEN